MQLGVGQELRGGLMAGPPLCKETLLSHCAPPLQTPPQQWLTEPGAPRSQGGTPRTPHPPTSALIAGDVNQHQEPNPGLRPPPTPHSQMVPPHPTLQPPTPTEPPPPITGVPLSVTHHSSTPLQPYRMGTPREYMDPPPQEDGDPYKGHGPPTGWGTPYRAQTPPSPKGGAPHIHHIPSP